MTFNLQTRSMTGCALRKQKLYMLLHKSMEVSDLMSFAQFILLMFLLFRVVSFFCPVFLHLLYCADVFFYTRVHSVSHHHPGNTVLSLTCNLNRRISFWGAVASYSHKGPLLCICTTTGTQRSVTLTLKDCHVQSAKRASVAALLILK